MPGYAATLADSSTVKSGLTCPHCELLLRDPVQTGDGSRLCRSCFDEIVKMPEFHCIKCNITVSPEEFYPDRAVQRELSVLIVVCKYVALGCDWNGVLKEWENHSEDCDFKGISCSFAGCNQMLLASKLEQHKLECLFRPANCEHCDLLLQFHELERHYEVCLKYPVLCSEEGCGEKIPREELPDHRLNKCPIEECANMDCSKKVLRGMGTEIGTDHVHLSSGLENFRHHQSLAREQQTMQKELVALKSNTNLNMDSISQAQNAITQLEQLSKEAKDALSNKLEELQSQLEALRRRIGRAAAEPQSVDNSLAVRVKQLETQDITSQQVIKTQRKEIAELKAELQAFKREYHHQQQQQRASHGRGHVNTSGRDVQVNEASESRVLQLEKRVEEVARQANTAQIQVHEVELQLQASLASTYNGGFLWRIPEIPRRRRDAVEERVMSLYSPPFYTARNGYKMCIRAYLNGDGMGYKTHLSLFFVLMKGEFDALLKWPFEHKISMILVDQDHRKHIVQTFKPTLDSNSFQRPKTDMNVASGCPQFAKLSILDETNYVREDVLFIKCIVDTSKIFHP